MHIHKNVSYAYSDTPFKFSQSSKGLRQRNPSVFLLMLVMEALSCLLEEARESAYLSSFKAGGWMCLIYYMSFTIPKSSNWGSRRSKEISYKKVRQWRKKPCIVKWTIVCMDNSRRLGIRSLSSLNQALFGKWSWRFASKGKAF